MILVTGAGGLLGTNLLFELTKLNNRIRAIVHSETSKANVHSFFRKMDNSSGELFNKIDWVTGDINDAYFLTEAFTGITKVYHCAAVVSFNIKDKKQMILVNRDGTSLVVNQCLHNNIEKLIHVSSVAAIKTSVTNEPAEEKHGWPSGMNNPYAYSKTQAEMEVWRGFAEGLKGAIVCPSVILGYGDWNRGSSEIFSRVYKGLGYYTLGVTGFVDVADVVSCMISLMESDIHSERFILNGANLSYKELFEKIAFSFGVKAPSNYARPYMTELAWRLETIKAALTFTQPRITKLISRSAHQQQYYSSAKIQETLNFGFTPIEKTLERIAALYLK